MADCTSRSEAHPRTIRYLPYTHVLPEDRTVSAALLAPRLQRDLLVDRAITEPTPAEDPEISEPTEPAEPAEPAEASEGEWPSVPGDLPGHELGEGQTLSVDLTTCEAGRWSAATRAA